MNILVLFISILCYIFAPNGYSQPFIVFLFLLFCFQIVLYLRYNSKGQLINFHTIFLLTSIIVVYLYPLFVHPIGGSYIYNLHEETINKGTALAQSCLAGYLYGVSIIHTKKKTIQIGYKKVSIKLILILFYFFSIYMCAYYIPFIGVEYGGFEKDDTTALILLLLFAVLITLNSNNQKDRIKNLVDFVSCNKTILLPIMIVCVVLLLVGIRYAVLSILLVGLVSYITYSQRINYRLIIIAGIFILFVFFLVVATRGGSSFNDYNEQLDTEIPKIFYVLKDLMCISNNLYAGVAYIEQYGWLYGASIIPQLFAPIPFMPSLLTQSLYGTNVTQQTTQYILSDFLGTIRVEHTTFVGTNCFVDLYMNCGYMLTILIFVCVGIFVQKITINRMSSIYYQFTYFILVSQAIFMVRDTLYFCYRPIIWGIAIIYTLFHLKNNHSCKL